MKNSSYGYRRGVETNLESNSRCNASRWSFRKQRDYMLTCLAAFQPIRLVPFEDITVESIVNPMHMSKDSIKIKIVGFKHHGRHKTYKEYGSAIMNVSKEMYELLLRYVDKLRRAIKARNDDEQPLFCKSNGDALDSLGNIISATSFKICSRKIRPTDFRRAKTTIGRRAGINQHDLSRAMMHSTQVADRYYDVDILYNESSLQYFHIVGEAPSKAQNVELTNTSISSAAFKPKQSSRRRRNPQRTVANVLPEQYIK